MNSNIPITIPDADVARYQAAIVAELDPAGNSGLTPAQLVRRYVAATLKEIVDRYERKQADAAAVATRPTGIAIT